MFVLLMYKHTCGFFELNHELWLVGFAQYQLCLSMEYWSFIMSQLKICVTRSSLGKKTMEQDNYPVASLLQSLKKASKDLQIKPISNILNLNDSKPAVEDLIELANKADSISIVSSDPVLLNLAKLLTELKTLSEKLHKTQARRDLKSLFLRRIIKYKIFQTACSIEAGIRSFTDREIVVNLVTTLIRSKDEDEKLKVLMEFGNRLSQGFDTDFQELVLRGRVLSVLEFVLCGGSAFSKRVRNQASLVVLGLVRFNKDVFIGLVLMGPTIESLITISSLCTIQVLCSMIRFIRTPLVDEIEAHGEIPRIIELLSSEDIQVKAAAMHSVLEMAFWGRGEVVEAIIREDLVEKLMVLQRLSEAIVVSQDECCCVSSEVLTQRRRWNYASFENCVARFSEQVQAGGRMEKREKREFIAEILRRVREAAVSDAEAATVVSEVLWSPSS